LGRFIVTSLAASAIELGHFFASSKTFSVEISGSGCKNLTYARHGKRKATDIFRAEVDFEQVLYRLALHAQSLFTAESCLGRRDELVLPGGDSAADLVSATLLKLLDPFNTSVTWSSTKGPPTTAGVLAYLREVLKRDFRDLVRSKRSKTSVYPDDERTVSGHRLVWLRTHWLCLYTISTTSASVMFFFCGHLFSRRLTCSLRRHTIPAFQRSNHVPKRTNYGDSPTVKRT
jgi:hypothetical protein